MNTPTDKTDALAAQLRAEANRKESVPTRVPTMNPDWRFVHAHPLRVLLLQAADAISAPAAVTGDGDDPHEFGAGIEPNPKASYWQERAAFWSKQAVALGWREKRDAENGEGRPAADSEAVACNDPMCDQTMKERDHAEDIIDQLCDAVLGSDREEWSSGYFFESAVEDVKDAIAAFADTRPPAAATGLNAAAKHWHDLYRKECLLRQDDAARYGQQIADLEAAAATVQPCEADVEAFAAKLEQIADTRNRITPGSLREVAAMIRRLAQPQRQCQTCSGRGEVGGHVGQTAESFDYVTEPCPDCQPQRQGRAVAWRCRIRGKREYPWEACTEEMYNHIRLTGFYNGPGGAACDALALYTEPPASAAVVPPDGDTLDGWAAWLRDRGQSFDPYIQGPMFNRLADWLDLLAAAPEVKP